MFEDFEGSTPPKQGPNLHLEQGSSKGSRYITVLFGGGRGRCISKKGRFKKCNQGRSKVEWFEEQFLGQKKGIICGMCGMEKATNKMN